MIRSFSLVHGDMHYGPHTWDDESGMVRGIQAAELILFGAEPWSHPSGIGDGSEIALRSNDGFIAMLMSLGYQIPPELTVENVPDTEGDPVGVIY